MNKKFLYLGIIIAVGISITIVYYNTTSITPNTSTSKYVETNLILKQKLSERGILLSSPIRLQTSDEIKQYCSFFKDPDVQKIVEYCTSTELKDKDGNFLGNIHMVGSKDTPRITLVLIQTDPFMSKIDSVKKTFDTAIDELVCNCWENTKPGNFVNVDDWVEGLRHFHTTEMKPHSKSRPIALDGRTMQMEITTNKEGYLWQLYINNTKSSP